MIAALILALSPSGRGLAAPGAESAEVKQAREHFRAGDELFKAGRFAEAYREFEAGFALSNRPLFLLNMAHAERRRGELRNARALYRRYLVMEPESKLRGEVEAVLQEIEAALLAEEQVGKPEPAPPADPPPVAPPPVLAAPPAPPSPPPAVIVAAPAPEPEPPPVYQRWWFWAGIGGVAVAAVATGLLLSRDPYTRNGSIGTLGQP